MKKMIAALFVVISASAFAGPKEVTFFYSGMEGRDQVFYACSTVETETEKYLELFGASDIEVWCTGGLEEGWVGAGVSVTASFQAPILSGREVAEVVKVKGNYFNPRCGLNRTIVKALAPAFSNVVIAQREDSCPWTDSNYSYTFHIVR